jgi:hypothetical protein
MLFLSIPLLGAAAQAAAVPVNHPILGTWSNKLPNGCVEVYTFRADGTDSASSADERAEGTYEISETPDEKGLYKLVDTVVRTNGKKDCVGGATPLGDVATDYVRFSRAYDFMMTCYDAAGERCFGPSKRISAP